MDLNELSLCFKNKSFFKMVTNLFFNKNEFDLFDYILEESNRSIKYISSVTSERLLLNKNAIIKIRDLCPKGMELYFLTQIIKNYSYKIRYIGVRLLNKEKNYEILLGYSPLSDNSLTARPYYFRNEIYEEIVNFLKEFGTKIKVEEKVIGDSLPFLSLKKEGENICKFRCLGASVYNLNR